MEQETVNPRKQEGGIITPASIPEKLTEEQQLIKNLEKLTETQLANLSRPYQKPKIPKRKTLYDLLNKDPTSMTLLRLAERGYNEELRKFDTDFLPTAF